MPKKRTLNLRQFQGSSSSASKTAGQDGGDSPTASVNERLNDLRKAESLEAEQKKRDLAELVSQKTVPPELRAILGVPESAPPKPKLGVRFRDRMRTPGPAAPKSWLGLTPEWQTILEARGTGRRKGKQVLKAAVERNRPKQLLRFTNLLDDRIAKGVIEPSGLVHQTLKRLAQHWDLLDEDDLPSLIDIPLRLRLRLLTYLGHYGPPIDSVTLQALTQGNELVAQLDLGGLAGHAPLSLKRLTKVLEPQKSTNIDIHDDIVDSWDAEDDNETALQLASPRLPFACLTHLCLSNPPPNVPWRDLLVMTKHTSQITHLSLAYWPRPTLTPNLATATVSSQRGPDVAAGGSHYYSSLDQDMTEPASLLRQLSTNMLCLEWLDIEGCADWMPALATLAAAAPLYVSEEDDTTVSDPWSQVKPAVMTIFTDTWKNLGYIHCAQGWLPSSAGILSLGQSLDADIKGPLLKYLQKHEDFSTGQTQEDVYEVEKRRARIWLECEQRMHAAGRRINDIRRARSCRPVTFDFGWLQKAV